VHIDKLKAYLGTPPRFWLTAATNADIMTADPEPATSPIPPNNSQLRDLNIDGALMPGKQKGLGHYISNPTLPPSIVENPMLPNSRKAVENSSSEMGKSSVQPDTDLTPVKEVDTLPVDEVSTVVKIPLTDNEPADVLEKREFQIETPTSGPTTTIAA